jgi:DNA-binding MarR family transcriptional regulator
MNHVPSDTPGRRLGALMHQLRGALGPSPEDVVGIDLPRHQLRALFIVDKHGPLSVGRLAQDTGASLASASSLADRRRVLLVVTGPGHEVVARLEARFHERFDRLVGAMSPDGRASLEAGLTDMIRAAQALGLLARPDQHPTHGDHP